MRTFTVKQLESKFALHGIKTKPALCGALHQCSTNGERHWLGAEAEGITANHTYGFKNLDDNIFKGDTTVDTFHETHFIRRRSQKQPAKIHF